MTDFSTSHFHVVLIIYTIHKWVKEGCTKYIVNRYCPSRVNTNYCNVEVKTLKSMTRNAMILIKLLLEIMHIYVGLSEFNLLINYFIPPASYRNTR